MIQKINAVSSPKFVQRNQKFPKQLESQYQSMPSKTMLRGVPASYISFRGKEEELNLSDESVNIINRAKQIAADNGNNKLTAYHVLAAFIEDDARDLEAFFDDLEQGNDVSDLPYISDLNRLANQQAGINLLEDDTNFNLYLGALGVFKENNDAMLAKLPKSENVDIDNIEYSKDFLNMLVEGNKQVPEINTYALLGLAFNTVTTQNIGYTSDFLLNIMKPKFYVSKDELKDSYMKNYDAKAVDVWNKLALGSNLFVVTNNEVDENRMAASLVKTLNAPKHGNFNSKNTSVYTMRNTISAQEMLHEATDILQNTPNKKVVILANADGLLLNSQNANTNEGGVIPDALFSLLDMKDDRFKLIFFQDSETHYASMQNPVLKKTFSDFISYSIPPMHAYEAQEFLAKNKKYLQGIQTPFTKEAREKAIVYADKIEGIFPDKGIDLMKRIASYYGEDKKRITTKDVDEFADIARDIFNKNTDGTNIVYDTGKNLQSLYGKETTKKDVEAIVKQIKTGKIGTRGLIIYSKDEEAGSGRRFTAQAIAGEAKVPFIEIDSSDFAKTEYDEDGSRISAKDAMSKIFADAKKSAEQNEHKTAIIFINNFEEFAFSGPYLPGYKQAMAQLVKEMGTAENEKINLLVIGSTEEYFAGAIPTIVRGFNQTLAVDSPAFNNKSRREIITNRLEESNLKLNCKTAEEKEKLINSLVKLTSYMSFVDIKTMLEKTEQITGERGKKKASLGEFIEAYLQLATGRTSFPEMPEYNKRATTSHECGHATNLEVMESIMRAKGKPWHQAMDVNFITLDPRGDFLGAVFQGKGENQDYPFEALFTSLVCAYGGYSCEKLFFDMDGSCGIGQDLAQATSATKYGVERYGFGHYTGKISNAAKISSGEYNENVYKDTKIILKNAQTVSDLITETYRGFNEWFTEKYSKLIGTNNCMIDGDDFRKALALWTNSQSQDKKEEIAILQDMVMDVIKSCKQGKIYGQVKKLAK